MTKLSVNINKIATLRNARGGNMPNVVQSAIKCERFGAQGITVHPRPDERHIRYQDVQDLKAVITTEFNIEGYPSEAFMQLVEKVKPQQVTLVPDKPDALTSNAGWNTKTQKKLLIPIVQRLKNISRVSIFIDADPEMVIHAKECGADRVELYTESYASNYAINRDAAIQPFLVAAEKAKEIGIGLNAGHDLNLENLQFFRRQIPNLLEVSIGHALICDALDYGLQNVILMYKRLLNNK